MTDEHDRQLTALFARAVEELPDNDFVPAVMAGVEKQARLAALMRIAAAAVIVLCALLLAAPLQDLIIAAMHGLMSPLVAFDHPLPALVLLPVNNVAAPLLLVFIALRALHRRMFS